MLAKRLLTQAATITVTGLVGLWAIYMTLHLALAIVEMDPVAPTGPDPLKDVLVELADTVGRIAALGFTPSPVLGGFVLAGAIGCRAAKVQTDKMKKALTLNKTDSDTPDNLPAANEPVVTTTHPRTGFKALENASIMVSRSTSLPASLDTVIAHEELYARRLEQDRHNRLYDSHDVVADDDVLMFTGPVQAILLDPMLAQLAATSNQRTGTAERRIKRVKHILDTTRPAPVGRELGYLLLTLIGVAGFITLNATHLVGLLIALPGAIVCAAESGRTLRTLHRHGVRVHGLRDIEVPATYPTINLDDGLHLATLAPHLWRVTPPTRLHDLVDPAAADPLAAHTSATTRPHAATTTPDAADKARRIAHVRDAVAELDAEWLDYQLDLDAWFLSKPQLRNLNDPIVKKYREAETDLRDLAAALTDNSTDTQIAAAETAARTALKAWGTANSHALQIGVSTLSPSEEAALHTLHGLVGQLNDRATPKAMWPQLITAITRTMDKLTTVPFALADIATLPVIESESRLRAITQHPEALQP